MGVAHAAWGGGIEHENYSPPLGGLSPTGRPTPKADAFSPPRRGFSWQFLSLLCCFSNAKWNQVNFKP
jgi:hypothetical protein